MDIYDEIKAGAGTYVVIATYPVLDRENITVSSPVVTFTSAKVKPQVALARVQVQVASIRVTEDGTDPAPATPVGEVYQPLDIFEVWGNDACKNFKAIREGASDGKIEVTYLGARI